MLFARFSGMLLALACFCNHLSPAQPGERTEPGPYLAKSVSYINPGGPVLGGIFTRPVNGGPFPAVLLVPGSGPQDRDETIANHKPFLVLADYLTRRGIAVLRVDRRGVGVSAGNFSTATTEDFISDAAAGVRYLMSRPDVDPKRVGLIGHGEGAMIAPAVAVKIPETAFLVLLAPPALPGEQVLLTQRERAERAAHVPESQIALDKKVATMLYTMAAEGKKQRDLERALFKQGLQTELADLWANQLPRLETPWLRSFLAYDPTSALEKVKCPVLALEGDKDMDVSPDQNLPALKAALARSGNPDVTVTLLPGLNYLLQNAATGLPMEYAEISESISHTALGTISHWIGKHVFDQSSPDQDKSKS